MIEAYHKNFDIKTMRHVTDMDPTKIETQLSAIAKSMIVSTRIRVARNLAMFPLNPGASRETRGQICELMERVYEAIDEESNFKGQLFRHTTISED